MTSGAPAGGVVGREPSLSDVASSAGVSLATASRVLSGSHHPVAEGTRQRVLSAAARLDFVPNLVARGLVARRSATFGVVVHDMTDEYFAHIARGIEDVAYTSGRAALICNSDRRPDKELAYVRQLRSLQVDAIVFTGSALCDPDHQLALEAQLRALEAAGSAVVCLGAGHRRPQDVTWSTTAAYQIAVAHLCELGHRRIGFVAGPAILASSHERLTAARAAMAAAGLDLSPSAVFTGDYTRDAGVAAAGAVVAHGGVTALLAANDQLAIGLVAGLRARGVAVPGDVSVVGFDDIASCSFLQPPLTTIRIPLYDVGALGARAAIDRLEGRTGGVVTVPVELVVRSSTAPPP
jgi:LacI family transcriptional regulator